MAFFTEQQAEEITSWIEWIPGITVAQRDSIQVILETRNGNVRSIFNFISNDQPVAAEMITDFITEFDLTDDLTQMLIGLDVRIRGKYS